MAKILVADDNSNVQKTVTLALEDLGVEVVAVNNGEAAVRKLSEVAPDMVLADIFMPVRNGYEVCEYVKKNPRFAHLPVVLLVGAFDPLDERESQRVGADGILKKPFVPPDPLIAMVKLMLERIESERPVMASVARGPQTANAQSSGETEAKPQAASGSHTAAAEATEEAEEFTITPRPVAFDDGEAPLAFGDLLNEPVEPSRPAMESSTVATYDHAPASERDAFLGETAFRGNTTETVIDEGQPANAQPGANGELPAATPEPPSAPAWKIEEDSLSQVPEIPLAVPESSALPEPLQEEPIPLDVVREETSPPEPAPEEPAPLELVREEREQDETPSIVTGESAIVLDPADQSHLTVEPGPAPDLAANPLEWMATAPAVPSAEPYPETANADNESPSAEPPAVDEPAAVASTLPAPESQQPDSVADQTVPVEETSAPAEVAADSNDSEETPVPASAVPPAEQEPSPEPESAPETTEPTVPIEVSPEAAALTDEAAVPATLEAPNASSAASSDEASSAAPPPPNPDPALVEAVVQRVLDKMRPQVVEIITKEFLRPVVQVLVRREIEKA